MSRRLLKMDNSRKSCGKNSKTTDFTGQPPLLGSERPESLDDAPLCSSHRLRACSAYSPAAVDKGICLEGVNCVINIESSRMQVLFCDSKKVISFLFTDTKQVIYWERVCPCNREHNASVEYSIVVNLVKKDCTCYSCLINCLKYSGETSFDTKLMIFSRIWSNVVSYLYSDESVRAYIFLILLVYVICQRMAFCPRRISNTSEGKLLLAFSLYPSYRPLLFSFFAFHGTVSLETEKLIREIGQRVATGTIYREVCSANVTTVECEYLDQSSCLWPTKTEDVVKIKGWAKKVFHPNFLASLPANERKQHGFDAHLAEVYEKVTNGDSVLKMLLEQSRESEQDSIKAFKSEHLDRYLTKQAKLTVSFPVPKPFAFIRHSNNMTEFRDSASSSTDESNESVYPVMSQSLQEDDPTKKCVSRSIKVKERKPVMVQDRLIPLTSSKYRTTKRKFISSVPKTDTKEECYRRYRIPFPLKTRLGDLEPRFSSDTFCELNEQDIKLEMKEEANLIGEKEDDNLPEVAEYRHKKPGGTGKARHYSLLSDDSDTQDAFQKRLKLPSEEEILMLTSGKSAADGIVLPDRIAFVDMKASSESEASPSCSRVSSSSCSWMSSSPAKVPSLTSTILADTRHSPSLYYSEWSQMSSEDQDLTHWSSNSYNTQEHMAVSPSRSSSRSFLSTSQRTTNSQMTAWSATTDSGPPSEASRPTTIQSSSNSPLSSQTVIAVGQVLTEILDFVDRNMEIPEFGTDPDLPPTTDEPLVMKSDERQKKSRMERELRKLVNVSVVDETTNITDGKSGCDKVFCIKGCVCSSLDWKPASLAHCGKSKCIFGCSCALGKLIASIHLDSSLAKEEQTWHQTFVKRKGKVIELVGNSKEKTKREKKLPQRFLNHIVGEDVYKMEKMKTSEPTLKRRSGSDNTETSASENSDLDDGSSEALWRLEKRRREDESSNESSSVEENDGQMKKTLRDRRLKLAYIAKKSNPKLIDVAIWCVEHNQYGCPCVNWVVMLKNNALVWKPESSESLTVAEMKEIPLHQSEYDGRIYVFDPDQHSSRTYGSFCNFSARNSSTYYRRKLQSELTNRLTFSNGFVKMKVLMVSKGTGESLRPADQNARFGKGCKYVFLDKTCEELTVDIVGEPVKQKSLDSKSTSNLEKRRNPFSILDKENTSSTPSSRSLRPEDVKVNLVVDELVKSKVPDPKIEPIGCKSVGVDSLSPCRPSLPSNVTAPVTPLDTPVSLVSPPSSFSPRSSLFPASQFPQTRSISHPSPSSPFQHSSSSHQSIPPTMSGRSRNEASFLATDAPNSEPRFKTQDRDPLSSSPDSELIVSSDPDEDVTGHPVHLSPVPAKTPPDSDELPDHSLLCLNPDFGYLKVLKMSPTHLVLEDPELQGFSHNFPNVDAASDWLNTFFKNRMTFFPATLVLKWVLVKPGVLRLKGSIPFDPEILKRETIVFSERILFISENSESDCEQLIETQKPVLTPEVINMTKINVTKKETADFPIDEEVKKTSRPVLPGHSKHDGDERITRILPQKLPNRAPLKRPHPIQVNETHAASKKIRGENPRFVRGKVGRPRAPKPWLANCEPKAAESSPSPVIKEVYSMKLDAQSPAYSMPRSTAPTASSSGSQAGKSSKPPATHVRRTSVPASGRGIKELRVKSVNSVPRSIVLTASSSRNQAGKSSMPPASRVRRISLPACGRGSKELSAKPAVSCKPVKVVPRSTVPTASSSGSQAGKLSTPSATRVRRSPVHPCGSGIQELTTRTLLVPFTPPDRLESAMKPTSLGRQAPPGSSRVQIGNTAPSEARTDFNPIRNISVRYGVPGYYDDNGVFTPARFEDLKPAMVSEE